MTGNLGMITSSHREWAAKVLDISTDQSDDDLAVAALQKIARNDFWGGAQDELAVKILTGSNAVHFSDNETGELQRITEKSLQLELEEFCQKFFHQPTVVRRETIQELKQRFQNYPALLYRLDQLEAGMELHHDSFDDETDEVKEIGQTIMSIFVAAPHNKGRLRREAIQGWGEDARTWRKALSVFKDYYPEIAALDPDFVSTIKHRLNHTPQESKAVFTPAPSYEDAEDQTAKNKSAGFLIAAGVLFTLIRVFAASNRATDSTSSPSSLDSYYSQPIQKRYPSVPTTSSNRHPLDIKPLNQTPKLSPELKKTRDTLIQIVNQVKYPNKVTSFMPFSASIGTRQVAIRSRSQLEAMESFDEDLFHSVQDYVNRLEDLVERSEYDPSVLPSIQVKQVKTSEYDAGTKSTDPLLDYLQKKNLMDLKEVE